MSVLFFDFIVTCVLRRIKNRSTILLAIGKKAKKNTSGKFPGKYLRIPWYGQIPVLFVLFSKSSRKHLVLIYITIALQL